MDFGHFCSMGEPSDTHSSNSVLHARQMSLEHIIFLEDLADACRGLKARRKDEPKAVYLVEYADRLPLFAQLVDRVEQAVLQLRSGRTGVAEIRKTVVNRVRERQVDVGVTKYLLNDFKYAMIKTMVNWAGLTEPEPLNLDLAESIEQLTDHQQPIQTVQTVQADDADVPSLPPSQEDHSTSRDPPGDSSRTLQVYRLSDITRGPGIYILQGKRGRRLHTAYVGYSNNVRKRVKEHLETESSNITASIYAVSLNPHSIYSISWFESPLFSDGYQREAAEQVAEEVFQPMLATRNTRSVESTKLLQDMDFRRELLKVFHGRPTGRYDKLTEEEMGERIIMLEKRVEELINRLG